MIGAKIEFNHFITMEHNWHFSVCFFRMAFVKKIQIPDLLFQCLNSCVAFQRKNIHTQGDQCVFDSLSSIQTINDEANLLNRCPFNCENLPFVPVSLSVSYFKG